MKAKTYLILDTVLVLCLIAFQAAPGIADMLKCLPDQVAFGIYLALLFASDFCWFKTLFSIRQIRSHRILCFLIFTFLTLINFVCTTEVVLGVIATIFHLS